MHNSQSLDSFVSKTNASNDFSWLKDVDLLLVCRLTHTLLCSDLIVFLSPAYLLLSSYEDNKQFIK